MSSYNIPMSYKLNQPLLNQLLIFCTNEGISYSTAVRAGLSLLFTTRKRNTRNTRLLMSNEDAQWE
jgi:hypothetical protein